MERTVVISYFSLYQVKIIERFIGFFVISIYNGHCNIFLHDCYQIKLDTCLVEDLFLNPYFLTHSFIPFLSSLTFFPSVLLPFLKGFNRVQQY